MDIDDSDRESARKDAKPAISAKTSRDKEFACNWRKHGFVKPRDDTKETDMSADKNESEVKKSKFLRSTDNEETPSHIQKPFDSKTPAADRGGGGGEEQEVMLTRTDRRGFVRPIEEGEDVTLRGGKKRRKMKKVCALLFVHFQCIYRVGLGICLL